MDQEANSEKQVIISTHNRGRMCNQIWNYAAVYAYCEEQGYECKNPSFFEYAHYFDDLYNELPLFSKLLNKMSRFKLNGNRIIHRKLLYWLYESYALVWRAVLPGEVMNAGNSQDGLPLPPNSNSEEFEAFEESNSRRLYLQGWPYENEYGLKKYADSIRGLFSVKDRYQRGVKEQIQKLKKNYDHVVGLQIRRGDYRVWNDGTYFFDDEEMNIILDNYLQKTNKNRGDVAFLITSDEEINVSNYDRFNAFVNNGGEIEDLLTLSMTDEVMGTRSTFSAFAAYYGNVRLQLFEDTDSLTTFESPAEYFSHH